MTEKEISHLAESIKRTLGVQPGARVAMIHLLEGLEDWMDDYVFHVLEDDAMPGMDGYSGLESPEICLSNSTYTALGAGEPDARFTAAHELGHLMLHTGTHTAYARRAEYQRHVDPEWQADYFADVFLMPAEGVLECASAKEVAHRFSVPEERARRRFAEITKIQGELFA